MEILKSGSPNQEAYQQEIDKFFREFVQGEEFSIVLFKATLLFAYALRNIQMGLEAASQAFDEKASVEFFEKEKDFYDAIFKSFKERQERLAK